MPNNSLRPIRERKGLTLAQLAGKTSISIRTLQMYENGERTISGDDLRKLSKVLFTPTAELLEPSPDLPPPPKPEPATPPPAPTRAEAPPTEATPAALSVPPTASAAESTDLPVAVRSVPDGETAPSALHAPPGPTEYVRRSYAPSGIGAPPRPGFGEYRRPAGVAPGPRAPRPPRESRPPREARPPRPPGPVSKGQLEQIQHLARRMGLDDAAVEDRIGQPLSGLNHMTAKQAIAKLHGELESSGVWQPRVGEGPDQEATYLGKLRDQGVAVVAQLIDGRSVDGAILDFTPYAILLRENDGNEVMVRKLAIAYYQTKGPVNGAE